MEEHSPTENVVSLCDHRQKKLKINAEISEINCLLCDQCGGKEFLLAIENCQIFCASCLVSEEKGWTTE